MKYIFIKGGGSGNIRNNNSLSVDYSYLNYRQMKIDSDYYKLLCDNVHELSQENKVGFTVGGVAAFLFLNFAKDLNNTDEEINAIGKNIVNITSNIVLNYFISRQTNICPKLVDVNSDIESYFKKYNLLLFKPDVAFESTDFIVAKAATKIENSILIFLKTNLLERLQNEKEPNLSYIKKISSIEKSTMNAPLLDMQTLEILESNKKPVILCDKNLTSNLCFIANQKAIRRVTLYI